MSNWWDELYEEQTSASSQDAWWDDLYEEKTPQDERVERRLGRLPDRPVFSDEPRLPVGIQPGRTPQGETEDRTFGAGVAQTIKEIPDQAADLTGQAVDAIQETDFKGLAKEMGTFAADVATAALPESMRLEGAEERTDAYGKAFRRSLARVPVDTLGAIQRQVDSFGYRRGGELPDYMKADFELDGQEASENPRLVDEINRYLDEKLAIPEELQDNAGVQLQSGLGSMAGFVIGGGGGGAAGARLVGGAARRMGRSPDAVARATRAGQRVGQYAATAPIAVSLSTEDAYNRALQYAQQNPELLNGLTPEEFAVERSLNPTTVISGLVQIANIERLVGPALKGVGKKAFTNYMADLGVAGTSEFIVESAGAVLQNLNEQGYNVDRGLFDQAFQQGGYGALAAIGLRGAMLPYMTRPEDGGGSFDDIAGRIANGEDPSAIMQEIMSSVDTEALNEAEAQGNFDVNYGVFEGTPVTLALLDGEQITADGQAVEGDATAVSPDAERVMPVGIPTEPGQIPVLDRAQPRMTEPEARKAFDLEGLDLTQSGEGVLPGLQTDNATALPEDIDAQPADAIDAPTPTEPMAPMDAPETEQPAPETDAAPAEPVDAPEPAAPEFSLGGPQADDATLTTPGRPGVAIPRTMVMARDLETDAEAYQYKDNADEEGVTERLQGVKRWDDIKAGRVVVHERSDGRRFIADGHQRLGLARRLEAEGHPPIQMDAILLRESDGFTVEDARELAATKNIAEGTGTAWDAARIFQAAGERSEDLSLDLPPNSAIVRDGRRLAKLSQEATQAAIQAEVNPAHAAIAADRFDDPTEQLAAIQAIQRVKPKTQGEVHALLEHLANVGARTDQGDMFGGLDDSVMKERIEIIDKVRSRIQKNKSILGNLLTNQGTIEAAAQNVVDQEGSEQAKQDADAMIRLMQHISTNAELNQYVNEKARQVADGEVKRGTAVGQVLERARTSLSNSVASTDGRGSGEVSQSDGQEVTDPTPDQETAGSGQPATLFDLSQQTDIDPDAPTPTAQALEGRRNDVESRMQGDGSVDMLQGDGELFAGPRPDQGSLLGEDATAPESVTPDVTTTPAPETGATSQETTATAPETAQPDAAPETDAAPANPGAIEGFGDDSLDLSRPQDRQASLQADLSSQDIESMSLSQIWPKSEIDAIEDLEVAAFMTTLRDEIPGKPRKAYKKKAWAEKVSMLRELAQLYEGDGRDAVVAKMQASGSLKRLLDKASLLPLIPRKHWGRISMVEINSIGYGRKNGEFAKMPMSLVTIDGKTEIFNEVTTPQHVAALLHMQLDTDSSPRGNMKFEVRRRPDGTLFINKTGDAERRPLAEFETKEEAFAYIENNRDDLIEAWEAVKKRDNVKKADVRRAENRERAGKNHRGDRDVTSEEFVRTFGLRHVDYGNWVSQGRGAKQRQSLLNEAYDAFMDLSDVLGIPSQAIGLNGELIITLGKRGSGTASAHFEPDMFLINLTKTRGAGSLAHEWFHALDNYFRKQRGDVSQNRDGQYITYKPEPHMVHRESGARMTRRQVKQRAKQNPESEYYSLDNWMLDPEGAGDTRPEIQSLFANLVEALDESPMTERSKKLTKGESDGYWSRIIERAARAFEVYVIDALNKQGYQNDFLANVVDVKEFERAQDRYPYLMPDEIKPVADAFDALFNEMQTRETGQGIALYSVNDEVQSGYGESGTLQDTRPESRFGRLQKADIAEAGSDAVQGDLFLRAGQPQEQRREIARRVQAEQVGTFRSGIERVQTPADAAHVVAPLRKRAAEVFGFLVTDSDGKPIAFKRQTIGKVDSAQVNMLAVGELYAIPGAAQVWMVHNHPSGTTQQSRADLRLLDTLDEIMRDTGLNFRGSVVVAPGGQYSFASTSDQVTDERIAAAKRYMDVPVEERVLRAQSPGNIQINTPAMARRVIFEKFPGQNGVLFLDTQHRPLAFYEMDAAEMQRLRTQDKNTGFGQLAQAAEGLNSSVAIISYADDSTNSIEVAGRVQNVGTALGSLEIRVLDAVYRDPMRWGDYASFAEEGKPLSANAFYSMAEPAPTYYSAVTRAVESIGQERAQGDQWLAMIQKQAGVKKEEIDWMGLPEWLESQDGTIDKADVLSFVQENEVQVNEVLAEDAENSDQKSIQEEADLAYKELETFVEEMSRKYNINPFFSRIAFSNILNDAGATKEEVAKAKRLQDRYRALSQQVASLPDPAQYADYTLPGGANYRELLLTLPEDREVTLNNYQSVHFGEKNIVAHARFIERTDDEGGLSLFIEEIQSDWHQEGRKHGYGRPKVKVVEREPGIFGLTDSKGGYVSGPSESFTYSDKEYVERLAAALNAPDSPPADADLMAETFTAAKEVIKRLDNLGFDDTGEALLVVERYHDFASRWDVQDPQDIEILNDYRDLREIPNWLASQTPVTPDAPFKQSWPLLTFKRMIRYAAENGFNTIAWTPGRVQAERYDLGNAVESVSSQGLTGGGKMIGIKLEPEMGDFEAELILKVDSSGTVTSSPDNPDFKDRRLDEILGKDLADRIMSESEGVYSGDDLVVGADGMVAFYDRILRSQVQKYVKKFGATVEMRPVFLEGYGGETVDAWTVKVTDQMRETAMSGQPMFQTSDANQSVPDASSVELFRSALGEKTFDALESSGLIRVVDGLDSVPGQHPSNAAAVYLDGVAYINARMVSKGKELGIVLHEIGVHKGLKDFIGSREYNRLSQELMEQVKKAREGDSSQSATEALRAYERAVRSAEASATYYRMRTGKAMSQKRFDEIVTEETWAYMAEAGSQASLVDRLIAAIKKALRSLGLSRELIGGLTNAEIAAVAHGSVARIVDEVATSKRSYFTAAPDQSVTEMVSEPAQDAAEATDELSADDEIRYSIGEESAQAKLPKGMRVVQNRADLDGSPLLEDAPQGDIGAVFDPASGDSALVADQLTTDAPRVMAQFFGYAAPDDLIGRVLKRRLERLAGPEGTIGGVLEPEFYGNENVQKALKAAKDYMLQTHNVKATDDHAAMLLKAYFNKPESKVFIIVDGEGNGEGRDLGDAVPNRFTSDQQRSPVLRDKLGSRWFNEWTRLFESAADNFENTTGLEFLGKAIRNHFDDELANRARMMTIIRPALRAWKKLPKAQRVEAERAFGNYFKAGTYDGSQGVIYDNAPQVAKDLIDAWLVVADTAGTLNQEAGIQVLDDNGWRDIGKVSNFYPRVLSELTERTLASVDPLTGTAQDAEATEHWSRIVEALLAGGYIDKASEAMEYIRQQSVPTQTADDFFSGIEMARKKALPEIFYDWSLMPALNYIDHWATRYSQIVNFGQKTDTQKDLFDQALDNLVYDQRTRRYVREAQSRIYNVSPADGVHRFMAAANLVATGTQLGNLATASLNYLGGTTLNWITFGEVSSLTAYKEMLQMPVKTFEELRSAGVLREDLLKVVQDFGETPSKGTKALAQATSMLLKIGGYTPTENVIRMHAAIAAKHYLIAARKAYAKNPSSKQSLKARAFVERLGLDFDRLITENGEYFEKYMRVASNLPQGTYRIDQTPIFIDTPAGRFLFKYQKFGTQVNRLVWRMHLKPFLETVKEGGEKVSTGERVKNFMPLIRAMYGLAIGGVAIVNWRDFLFDYGQQGPEEDELEKALQTILANDDMARGLGILMTYVYHQIVQAGGTGFYGNYIQWAKDFTQQTRVKDPLDPPGLAPLDLARDIALTFFGQGVVTPGDAERLIERYFSLYRSIKRPAIKAIGFANEQAYLYKLQSATKDSRYISRLSSRWASDQGLAEGRSIANATFIPNENKPYTRKIVDAIRAGKPERARAVLREAQEKMTREEYDSLLRSARSSVRRSQPVRLNGQPMSREEREAFFAWAKERIGEENYWRIIRADEEYLANARMVGMMR